MPGISQDVRLLRIDTPLGDGIFMAVELQGEETISELFQFQVELVSTELGIEAVQLVGQKVTLALHYNSENPRYINGIVSEFCAGAMVDVLRSYHITVVPSLWLLTLSQGSAIHQAKTTRDIVSDYLGRVGVEFQYKASVADKREYCVQYQETDFEFVARLLAEEGLSYYFSHQQGSHELIIVDKNTQYFDCAEGVVEWEEANTGMSADLSRITEWQRHYQMHTGKLAMTGYLESAAGKGQNLTIATRNSTLNNLSRHRRHYHDNTVPYLRVNQLPQYGNTINQKKTAELMLEAEESGFDKSRGAGNCCSFAAGGRFELNHRLPSESGKYLLTRVSHFARSDNSGSDYHNRFVAVPATTPTHPAPPAHRLRINGPHLAAVIEVKAGESPGPGDPQLMVKVQLYWDEEQSSCWVRVMQHLAGNSQGSVFVPEIGSEVVVEFVGGDPDRPLVTGAVYNDKNKAPEYSNTQCGVKTASNEWRFDDHSGEEEVYFEAGKNLTSLVQNDESSEVVNDQNITVGNDQLTDIGNDQNITVGATLNIEAQTSICLKVGANTITIDSSGITLEASQIKGSADTAVEFKGGASAKLEGGGTTEVKAGGMLTIKGSLTKIN